MSLAQSNEAIKLQASDIKKFQLLYLKHFNETLTDEQSRAELSLLVRQLEIIYQPITISQFDKYIQLVASEDSNNGSFA